MAQTQMTESSKETKNEKKTGSNQNIESLPKKIVMRRLPPSLTKDQFLDIVSPLPEHDYFYFCNSDPSLGQYGFSRAYIYFKNYDDIFSFRDRFDNYVFVDSKSNEYPAVVEFAPYQRKLAFMATDSETTKKKDSKCNTIDQDNDYLNFLENFDKPTGAQLPSCEAILDELEQKEKEKQDGTYSCPKVMTPLLEYLKKKKEEKSSRSSKHDRDRDRDRDRGDRRRRGGDDRDRDRDDKRYGNKNTKQQNNRDRDRDRDNRGDRDNYSSNKSKSNNKDSSKSDNDFSNVKILTKSNQSSSSNKNESDKFSSNKPSQTSNNSSNSNRSNTSSNAKQSNSNNSSSKNADSVSSSKNNNNNNSNSSKPSSNTNSSNRDRDYRDRDNDSNRDNNSKPVKNKDRPSIQIYNPGQRAAQRQQGSSSKNNN